MRRVAVKGVVTVNNRYGYVILTDVLRIGCALEAKNLTLIATGSVGKNALRHTVIHGRSKRPEIGCGYLRLLDSPRAVRLANDNVVTNHIVRNGKYGGVAAGVDFALV